MKQYAKKYLLLLVMLIVNSGCQSSFGPGALVQTHPAYNQAIANSVEQEMLLNLVRLRYRDNTYFLKIGSVTASLSLEATASAEAEIDLGPGGNVVTTGAGVRYADQPTISYTPLQGEDFLKSVLTPISLEAILVLIQSGWSIERIFGICIERMNNLYNAPRASGPTPEDEPEYKDYGRMLELFRVLQLQGDLEIGPDFNVKSESRDLIMLFKRENVDEGIMEELDALLRSGMPESEISENKRDRVRIITNFLVLKPDQISIRTRSISSLLFYLSQNIEVPEEHINYGLVTITKSKQGIPYDWSETPAGRVFKIQSSKSKPANTILAVPYRDYWFYVAENDLQSKSTFLLLMQLFNLQAGQTVTVSPTLTIPVTR
jgi:hypothetical protein